MSECHSVLRECYIPYGWRIDVGQDPYCALHVLIRCSSNNVVRCSNNVGLFPILVALFTDQCVEKLRYFNKYTIQTCVQCVCV